MWLIRDWTGGWARPRILAAYELIDGHVIFAKDRGDNAFVRGLQEHGVPVIGEDGQEAGRVHPDQGPEFHNACLLIFSTRDQSMVSEEMIAGMERKLNSGGNNSEFPPGINAA